jgi:hypothetical protein
MRKNRLGLLTLSSPFPLLHSQHSEVARFKLINFWPLAGSTGHKILYFLQHSEKAKKAKWSNHLISCKLFQKGKIWLIWALKRPIGNPANKLVLRIRTLNLTSLTLFGMLLYGRRLKHVDRAILVRLIKEKFVLKYRHLRQ